MTFILIVFKLEISLDALKHYMWGGGVLHQMFGMGVQHVIKMDPIISKVL